MWASMSLSLAAPAPFATTKPAANCLTAGASRKFQLYSQLRNLDLAYTAEQKQQIRKKSQTNHLGYTAEQKQKQRFWKKSQTTNIQQAEEERVQVDLKDEEKKLTGFDVLQALEKATARKMKKKRHGRDSSSLSSSRKVSEQAAEDEAMADYGSKIVRPLSIREDWGTRLDELEKRLNSFNLHNC